MAKYQSKFELLINASSGGAKRVLSNLQNDIRTTGSVGKRGGGQVKSAWVGAGVAMGALVATGYALKKALDFAVEGEKIHNVGVAFRQLNADAEKTLATLDKALRGTVDATSMQQFANQLKIIGLEASDMGTIADASFKIAATQGLKAVDVMKSLATAIGTGRLQTAAQYGIVVDAATAQEQYAKELGVTASSLDAMGKKQALINALLSEADTKFGDIDTSHFRLEMQKTKTALDNLYSDMQEGAGVAGNAIAWFFETSAAQIAHHAYTLRHPLHAFRMVTHELPEFARANEDAAAAQRALADEADRAAQKEAALAKQLDMVTAAVGRQQAPTMKLKATLDQIKKAYVAEGDIINASLADLEKRRKTLDSLKPSIDAQIQAMGEETESAKKLAEWYAHHDALLKDLIPLRQNAAAAAKEQSKAQEDLNAVVGQWLDLDLKSELQQAEVAFRKGALSAAQMFAIFQANAQASGIKGFVADAMAGLRTLSLALDESEKRAEEMRSKRKTGSARTMAADPATIDAESAQLELALVRSQDKLEQIELQGQLARHRIAQDFAEQRIDETLQAHRMEMQAAEEFNAQAAELARRDVEAERERQRALKEFQDAQARRRKEQDDDERDALAARQTAYRENTNAINQQIEAARSSFDALAASGVDAAGRIGMALNEARTIADAFNQAIVFGNEAAAKTAPGAIAAFGRMAGAAIENDKAMAAVKGAFEAAAAVASFAVGDIVGGAQHAIASGLFFAVAGKGKSSGGSSGASSSTQQAGTGSTPEQVMSGPSGGGSTSYSVINLNGFLGTKQEIGEKVTEAQNSIAGLGKTIDPRLIGTQQRGF